MLKIKRKSLKILALFILGLLFFSGIFTVITFTPIESIIEENNELFETEENLEEELTITSSLSLETEEYSPPSYNRETINWRPIEQSLSQIQPEAESGGDYISTSTFNVIGGKESVIPYQATPSPETMPELSVVDPYAGLLVRGDTPESVIGLDDRILITDNELYPWRTVTKLYISAADGTNWIGSGMIIDNFHVLTAGHCVYLHDNGGWASSIEIVPGMDLDGPDPTDPYGHAWATYYRSYTGWIVSESADHDWAMLTLDRNVGAYTGWMGRTTAGSSSSIYTDVMNVAGYPSDLDGGRRLYWDADDGAGATEYRHYYYADTAGGMSGGPVWRYESGNRYIMTIHAYGGTTSNSGTRLNSDKFNRIFDWVAADTAPTDRPDLTDRGSAYRSLSSYSVTAGISSLTINHQIRNKGTASSGDFYVYYYASTNNDISTSDYYIGYDYVSSISPFSTASAGWTGTFPNIPGGNYYIGWIIDRDNYITEFDESNNVAYETPTVSVTGLNPPISYIEVRAYDADTYSYLQSAYVRTYVHGTSSLVNTGYTDVNGFYNITNLAIGTYDIIVSKNGYQTQTKTDVIDNLAKGYDDDYLYYYIVPYGRLTSWIEVTVKDSVSANPISSAYVQVTNMSSGLVIKSGYTSGTGFYNVTGLSIGWYDVSVSQTSYKPQTKQNFINWNHDDDYLTFNLVQMPPDSGYIEVRVYNETGRPKSGAYIKCVNDTSGLLIRTGYTDANGFFNITHLTIGWYTVNVSYGSYYAQSKSNFIEWYGDDDYLTFYLMVVPPDSGYIEVNVYDSITFLPIYFAYVEVTNQSSGLVIQTGYTDTMGFFKVWNLTVGWYTVHVSYVGYYEQSKSNFINWAGDDDYLYFYIEQKPPDSGYIEVVVKDTNTMAPIQNALVTCYYSNGTYFKSGYTDSSGFYNITGLYIGWYDIVVTHSDYGGDSKSDYIHWNGDDDYLTFYLMVMSSNSGYIEIRVYNSYNSYPIAGVHVQCFNYTSGVLFDEGYTDANGFFNVTHLTIGWYIVNVSYVGYYEQSKSNFIDWNGDHDYLYFYLDPKFEPILGPIAIFRDILPWNKNMTEPILRDNGISYTVYSSLDFGTVDLSSYEKVIIVSDQYQSFYDRLAGNVSYFESYVSNGGSLEFHGCDRGWGGGNWDNYTMMGNITKTHLYLDNVSINLESHPLLLIPSLIEDDELDGWYYSAHGYFTNYPLGTKEILLYPVTSDPVLIEFPFGSGYIIATMQTLEWNQYYNYTRLLENLILYDPGNYYETLDIISPDNASVWEISSTHTITWTAPATISDVKIDLYENGVFVMEIATTPNDGEFSWTVHIGLGDSVNYQIKISDPLSPTDYDFSDNFEIIDLRSITVISPDSTSSWVKGNTYDITWSSTGTIVNVKIELYLGGSYIMDIVASTVNNGSYAWIPPHTLIEETHYIIRISDTLDPSIYDDSQNFEIIVFRSIILLAPDNTCIWFTGTTYDITWISTGTIANVKIELYLGGSYIMDIVASTVNNGSYAWKIPVSLANDTQYLIQISDTTDPSIYNNSQNFEIVDLRSITVISPDSTSSWNTGNTYDITWSSTGTIVNVKIELYLAGTYIMDIVGSTANNGSYAWIPPHTLADETHYMIRISDTLDPSIYNNSQSFEIVDIRSITVVSPESTSSWNTGNTYNITWTSTGIIANVKIELYLGGTYIMDIVASTPNDGSYAWTPPHTLTDETHYIIRISDTLDPSVYDDNQNFEIVDIRSITVISPESTSSWNTGNTYDITWTSTGTIANVKIELYLGGNYIMDIAGSTPNDGSYAWTIPDTLVDSDQYVIRVSDATDTAMTDDSDAFSITAPSGGGIFGYDILILLSLIFGVSLPLIKKVRSKRVHRS